VKGFHWKRREVHWRYLCAPLHYKDRTDPDWNYRFLCTVFEDFRIIEETRILFQEAIDKAKESGETVTLTRAKWHVEFKYG
jgi:hypothetical protein